MPKNYKQLLAHFGNADEGVKSYFPFFERLVTDFEYDVAVSYVFTRVEIVKRMTIYCGIVKLHRCQKDLTWKLVSEDYMDRSRFKELFLKVFGRRISKDVAAKLEKSEKIRDKIAHGMEWTDKDARECLASIIDFAVDFNGFVASIPGAGFRPFGDLRGFKGRKEPLGKSTTRWVLMGMGIPKKGD